jgi:hypothetical protein
MSYKISLDMRHVGFVILRELLFVTAVRVSRSVCGIKRLNGQLRVAFFGRLEVGYLSKKSKNYKKANIFYSLAEASILIQHMVRQS